jgi:hypothetical protein
MKTAPVPGSFIAYIGLWSLLCVLTVLILIRDHKRLLPEWRAYLGFLGVRWKLCLFVPAFLFVTFAGRFTDDETWDAVTGAGMATLTFLTAPWAIGLLYQVTIGRRTLRYLLVALSLLLFASSWFYDGYLLWRDGAYTPRWLGNLMLSPFIYVAAGLLWNLEATEADDFRGSGGYRFSFTREDWPTRPLNTDFAPLIAPSLPFILMTAFVLVAFVGWRFGI